MTARRLTLALLIWVLPLAVQAHEIGTSNVRLTLTAHSDDRDQSFQRIATSVTWVRDGAVGCCF